MNAAGAELLLRAQAEGRKQAIDMYHDGDADCAMGVLHIAVHGGDRAAAVRCDVIDRSGHDCIEAIAREYGVTHEPPPPYEYERPCPICQDESGIDWTGEQGLVSHLNDAHRLPFGEIARLLGPAA